MLEIAFLGQTDSLASSIVIIFKSTEQIGLLNKLIQIVTGVNRFFAEDLLDGGIIMKETFLNIIC